MAKSTAERQAEYRARLVARAALFDAANEARKRALLDMYENAGEPCGPEDEHVRQYFLNNPHCSFYPGVSFEDGLLHAWFGGYSAYRHEIAAFIVAVRKTSSVPIRAGFSHGDGASGIMTDVSDLPLNILNDVISAEETLRDAGLWGA